MSSGEKRLLPWPGWPKPTHVIYAIALIAITVLARGSVGVCFCVLCFWFLRSWLTPVPYSRHTLDVRIAFLVFPIFLFMWVVRPSLPASGDYFSGLTYRHPYGEDGRMPERCRVGPKLGRALVSYKNKHGYFPPAFIADEEGTPMHSWRVLLLPYLGQQEVYNQYRFDEPWDSSHNSQLIDKIPRSTFSWRLKSMATTKLVTGPDTVYPDHRNACDIPKDRSIPPILIVEDTENPVCWMKPEDLTIDEALKLFDRKASPETMRHVVEGPLSSTVYYVGTIKDSSGKDHMAGTLDNPEMLRSYFSAKE